MCFVGLPSMRRFPRIQVSHREALSLTSLTPIPVHWPVGVKTLILFIMFQIYLVIYNYSLMKQSNLHLKFRITPKMNERNYLGFKLGTLLMNDDEVEDYFTFFIELESLSFFFFFNYRCNYNLFVMITRNWIKNRVN